MKKIIFLLSILFAFYFSRGQYTPQGYTYIGQRYNWLAGKFEALTIPGFNGTPTLRTGQWTGAGALAMDTVTGAVYIYYGAAYHPLTGSGTVTSIGLSMPSAFTVTSSPITSSGTIAVTGAGTTSQYIRGNGSLSTFQTDVYTSGDLRYAMLSHTHTFSQITDGTTAVRNLFSAGSGLSYNPTTGVFAATGSTSVNWGDITGTIGSQTDLITLIGDTASAIRSAIPDTSNHWVNSINANSSVDSIIYYIGSTRYAFKYTPATPTLQQVFNTEVGGSVLSKTDTIKLGINALILTGAGSNFYTFGSTNGSFHIEDATKTSDFIFSSSGYHISKTPTVSGLSGSILIGDSVYINSQNTSGSESWIKVKSDSLVFNPYQGNFRVTNLSAGAGTKAVRWDATTNRFTIADTTIASSTPTWQQTLTAGSTLTTNNTIENANNLFQFHSNNSTSYETYLKLKSDSTVLRLIAEGGGAYFKLLRYSSSYQGIDLGTSTTSSGSSRIFTEALGDEILHVYNTSGSGLTSGINMASGTAEVYGQNNATLSKVNRSSYIADDSIKISPYGGVFNIDDLQNTSDTTSFKPIVWNPTTGSFRKFNYWPGGGSSTPTWQQTLTSGSTLTTNNTVENGTNLFEFHSNNSTTYQTWLRLRADSAIMRLADEGGNAYFKIKRYSSSYQGFDINNATSSFGSSRIYTDLPSTDELLYITNTSSTGKASGITLGQGVASYTGYYSASLTATQGSNIEVTDSIRLNPFLGKINIDSIQTTADTTSYKPTVWNPTTGSFRKFDYWPIGTGGSSTLSGLTDANISSPSNLQFLQYQTSDNKWHNHTLASSDIPDLSATYIKNQTSQQASANFNIAGKGVISTTSTSSAMTTGLSVTNAATGAGLGGSVQSGLKSLMNFDGATYNYTSNNIWNSINSSLVLTNTSSADKIVNLYVNSTVANSSTATDLYDVYLESPVTSGGGAITNYYGLFQASSAAKNYLAGETLHGSTTDYGAYALQVTGDTYVTGSITNASNNMTLSSGAGTGIYLTTNNDGRYISLRPNSTDRLNVSNETATYGYNVKATGTFGVTGMASVTGGFAATSYQSITTGSSSTVSNGTMKIIFDPASDLTAYTLTLPASPTDGQEIEIIAGGTIAAGSAVSTSFTLSPNTGQSILTAVTPTQLYSGDVMLFTYKSSNTTWYRKK